MDAAQGTDATTSDAGATPTTVAVTLTGVPTDHGFIAMYEDGTGPWLRAPSAPGSAGVYTFVIDSPTWGFGYACDAVTPAGSASGSATIGVVLLNGYTVAERTSLTESVASQCRDPGGTAPITVANNVVTNLPVAVGTGDSYTAWFGAQKFPVAVSGTTGSFTLANIGPSTRDLFIVHTPAPDAQGSVVADYVARVPRVVETGSGSAVTVDWAAAPGSGGSAATVTMTGSGTSAVQTILYTSNFSEVALSSSPTTSAFLAASQMANSDVYEQVANYTNNLSFAEYWTNAASAPPLAAPATLGGILVEEHAQTPYPILSTQWDADPDAVAYEWTANETLATSGATDSVQWLAFLSASYLGATPRYVMPDLSALTGWSTNAQLVGGRTMVSVAVQPLSSSGGIADVPFANPAPSGTKRSRTVASAVITLH